jgi:hypothetical protein
MRNVFLYNFPAFDEAAARLRAAGHEVVNPADLDRARGQDPINIENPSEYDWSQVPTGMVLQDIIDEDIALLSTCDVLYLLQGWQSSVGARAEKAYMEWRGKTIVMQDFADFKKEGEIT